MQEISVFFVAVSPILELRGAIPLGIGVYGMAWEKVYALSVLGNLLPMFLILLLQYGSSWLVKNDEVAKVLSWVFAKTRRNHEKRFVLYKELALLFLVAIPLPFTGVWTASIAAFVFGIPFVKAFPFITAGVIIAGGIVTGITLGLI